jgi:hypothetical protein
LYREKVAFVRRAFSDKEGYEENLYKYHEGEGWDGYEPFNPEMHAQNVGLTEKNLDAFHRMILDGDRPNLNPDSLQLLEELCRLATSRGSRFYLTLNPNAHIVQDDPHIRTMTEQLHATLQTVLSRHEGCSILPRVWVMDDQYLSDLTHTNHAGALLFTQGIASEYMHAEGLQ